MVQTLKRLSLGMILILLAGFFVGCGDDRARDYVGIYVREEYREKYESREFVLEDFEWENAETFAYYNYDSMMIVLKLANTGLERVREAMDHLDGLPFVKRTEYGFAGWLSSGFDRDYVVVYIRETYREKFRSRDFSLEDFEWSNAETFIYYSDDPMTVVIKLKDTGGRQVHEAVNHMNELQFTERTEYGLTTWASNGFDDKNIG